MKERVGDEKLIIISVAVPVRVIIKYEEVRL